MHLSLDIQLTQALWAAVSSGTQESDLAPTVTSPELRFGSGLAGHIVGFHVALSEGLPGVAISVLQPPHERRSPPSPCQLLFFLIVFYYCCIIRYCYGNILVCGKWYLTVLQFFVRPGKSGAFFPWEFIARV